MLKGNKISIGSSEPKRDFIYISDVLDAFTRIVNSSTINPGNIFNISTSYPTSIKELADKIKGIIKFHNEIKWNSNDTLRKGDPMWLVADNRKANEVFGWHPEISLDYGLEKVRVMHK
jgi:UDP-glucose 4-epimerase